MGACADAELLAEAGAEAVSAALRGRVVGGLRVLVGFADVAEGGEALFHGGIAHAAGVEIVGEAVV